MTTTRWMAAALRVSAALTLAVSAMAAETDRGVSLAELEQNLSRLETEKPTGRNFSRPSR
jgi:hypothetical protein